ncbi:MAG: LVIVD repeat-containing protein [Promethearchaeota archaeon]
MKQKKSIFLYALLISSLFIYVSIDNAHAAEFKQIISAHVGHYQPSGVTVMFEDVEINGTYAYVSDASLPGLRVISLANPSNPSLTAERTVTGTNSYEIEIANDVAYLRVYDQDYVIKYFDISSPLSPIYKGLLELGYAMGFDASETTLFVNNYTDIISFNFSDVDNTAELDRLDLIDVGQSLTFVDNFVYICTSTNQLKIVNATNPSNLNLISSFDLGDYYAQSYLVEGNILYTSGFDSTKTVSPERVHRAYVKSIDITNKSDLILLSDIFIDGINGVGLALHANKLFSGACAEGISVIDVTNPSSLQPIGYYDDYQDIYCGGSEHYAMYPKLYEDATFGNLLVFTSMGCGLNIISVDNLEFEFSIPGFEIYILILSAMMGLSFIYIKLRKKINSSKSI